MQTQTYPPTCPVSARAVGLPILYRGLSGPAVADLQRRLNARLGIYGAPVTVDGHFDPLTAHAVHTFQYSFFLDKDDGENGIVGPQTWAALYSGNPPNLPMLSLGSEGREVAWLQAILIRLGLYHKLGFTSKLDGRFGPLTQAAVAAYQASCSIAEREGKGIVGPLTWRALSRDRLRGLSQPMGHYKLRGQQQVHTGEISAIAAPLAPRSVFTGSRDGRIGCWQETGEFLGFWDICDRKAISDLRYQPSTEEIVLGTEAGEIYFHTLQQTALQQTALQQTARRFPGRGEAIEALDRAPSGSPIATGSRDGALRLFTPEGHLQHELHLHGAPISDVCFNPRSEAFAGQLVSVDTDGLVVLWQEVGGPQRPIPLRLGSAHPPVNEAAAQGGTQVAAAISHNGYLIAVVGGSSLRLYSSLGSLLYRARTDSTLSAVTFSPCDRYLALACANGEIHLLDLSPSHPEAPDIAQPVAILTGHSEIGRAHV